MLAVLLVLWGAVTARLFIWPDLAPLPAQVDAIVELGGPGNRDSVALALAREHRARFVVQSTNIWDGSSNKCLPPVAGVTVLCFHADPETTRGEAQYIRRLAAEYNWKSIVLVTTPDQAWRAGVRVSRCFSGDIYVRTATLPLLEWPGQIAYQWVATVKAFTIERDC